MAVTRGYRTNPVHPVWEHIGTHIRWMLYVDLVSLSSIPFETMGRLGSCSNSQLELESSTTLPCKWMHAKSPKQCTCACIHLRHLTKLYDALCYDCYVSRYLYHPMLSSAFPVFPRFPCKPCHQGALSGCLLQPRKNATDQNSQQWKL